MDPTVNGYRSLERIVLIPAYREDRPGITVEDPESLASGPASMPDADLGAVVIRLLRDQRPRDFERDFRGAAHRQRLAVRRKLVCEAFGVRAAKEWLADATRVLIVARGGVITVTATGQDGKQDAWGSRKSDPVGTASMSDLAAVGATVRALLAVRLPPFR